ncbi:MAG: YdcF family protein [Acidimicrobiales bacterium]|nr:YdcF family protein [Acidimicrobiales bacterium]
MTAVAERDGVGEAPPRVVRRWRRPRVVLAVLGGALGLVLVYFGVSFLQVWRATTKDHAQRSEAIVVLGAAQYNGRPSPVLQDRLDHALWLYRHGIAPMVVVTGGRQAGDRFTEATAGYDYLRHRGVPDKAIRKEVQGRSTYQSLAATARFLKREGIHDVVLVSSAAHAMRIGEIAGELGLSAHVSPASHHASFRAMGRETVAVAVGRVIGFRRLDHLGS